jgi:DNA-binding MarR family transcriptional regulator
VGRRLGTATILFHAAAAERMGLGPTEAKCRTLLAERSMTAGELAEVTGLTTGAVTGLIDRLEDAGVARRTSDPSDRRRVIVEAVDTPARERQRRRLVTPMGDAMATLAGRYTACELETIRGFLEGACEILERETRRLGEGAPRAATRRLSRR